MFESGIQDFKGLAHRLAQFDLLLRDWPLSEDDPDLFHPSCHHKEE